MPTATRQQMNGHALPPWLSLDSFPRDGRIVEIRDTNGEVWLATWQDQMMHIDADHEVVPTAWRLI